MEEQNSPVQQPTQPMIDLRVSDLEHLVDKELRGELRKAFDAALQIDPSDAIIRGRSRQSARWLKDRELCCRVGEAMIWETYDPKEDALWQINCLI